MRHHTVRLNDKGWDALQAIYKALAEPRDGYAEVLVKAKRRLTR